MSLVSLANIPNASSNYMKTAISKSLDLINYSWKKDIKNVIIKTNLCYYWDFSTGQTTDPRFIASLIELIKEKVPSDPEISVIESDASAMKCKYAYRFLGYEKLFKDSKVKLVNLCEQKSYPIMVECAGKSYNFRVPEIFNHADLKINVPKIKYAAKGIELTCALKNIYGCNPYPQKFRYHPQLGKVIVALNKAMKFDLVIIDGNIVSGVQPRKLGLVMASHDPVAIDAAAAKIAGLNPRTIKYLRLAEREDLGRLHYIATGGSIDYYRTMYPRKTLKKKMIDNVYPWVLRLKLAKKIGIG
jgi:uncharacterized protein (DUF362 family)